jgi:Holliday junction resolvase-like predicted endonuclease
MLKQKDSKHNKKFGNFGESIAKKHYEKQGYLTVSQNKTEKGSELDLVLKDKEGVEMVFVEVKSMIIDNKNKLTPEDNFTKQKQKFFKRGIELFLVKNKVEESVKIRIDLACVYLDNIKKTYSIKIYENIILE